MTLLEQVNSYRRRRALYGSADAGRSVRDERATHYLGNLTWKQACERTGVDYEGLPETTADV